MITATEPARHHHNRLQSLCNAVCTEGLPEVATNKYKEKAAVSWLGPDILRGARQSSSHPFRQRFLPAWPRAALPARLLSPFPAYQMWKCGDCPGETELTRPVISSSVATIVLNVKSTIQMDVVRPMGHLVANAMLEHSLQSMSLCNVDIWGNRVTINQQRRSVILV